MKKLITILLIISFLNCIAQNQYSSVVAATDTNPLSLNLRNDQSSTIQLCCDTLFCAYSRYGNASDPATGGTATIYGKFSYTKGYTWEAPFILIVINASEVNYAPSLIMEEDSTVTMLFVQKISSNYYVKEAKSSDGCNSFTGTHTIHTFTKKSSPAPDRIVKLNSGTLIYPTSQRTNNLDNPQTATNNGRLLYRLAGTSTWVDSGLDFKAADSSCQEPGAFVKGDTIYYYWRSDRTPYQKYITLSESNNFSVASTEHDLGYWNPSATTVIKYDTINDVFWAVKHEVYRKVTLTSTDEADRVYLELYASRRTLAAWQRVGEIDYEYGRYFLEPSLTFIDDNLLVIYSKYIPYPPSYRYDMLARMIPMVAVLPMLDGRQMYNHLDIVYRQPFWQNSQYGGGGDSQQPEFLSFTFDKYSRWDAYWRFRNNRDAKYGSFNPTEEIKTNGSTRGVIRWLDMTTYQTAFPFQTWMYSYNGAVTSIAATQPLERRMLGTPAITGLILNELYPDGRYKYFGRIELAKKTQNEINAFSLVADGQMLYNLTTGELIIRKNGVWKNVLTN